jgi:hypothetical protein
MLCTIRKAWTRIFYAKPLTITQYGNPKIPYAEYVKNVDGRRQRWLIELDGFCKRHHLTRLQAIGILDDREYERMFKWDEVNSFLIMTKREELGLWKK